MMDKWGYYPWRIMMATIGGFALLDSLWETEFGESPIWLRWGVPVAILVGGKIGELFTVSKAHFLDVNSD